MLLCLLIETWELLPKAEEILMDAMLYLLEREYYQYEERWLWEITEEDLLMAEAVTRLRPVSGRPS